MPTPTGLLKPGDRIRHKESGATFTVVKREGNQAAYSVIVRYENPDNAVFFKYITPPYGYPKGHMRLLEVDYWVGRTYEVIS